MTIEQKLYQAYRTGRGVRFSWDEVRDMLIMDDAIGTRVTNQAATDGGGYEPGDNSVPLDREKCLTWKAWGDEIRRRQSRDMRKGVTET